MEIVPIGPGFGAELRGVTLAEVAERDDLYAAVRDAFEAHSVLLFRNQVVSDDAQVAFSRRFGPLETVKVASLGAGTPFSILKNLGDEGRLVPPGHRETLVAKANQLWHTDSSFKRVPALASILSARTIPSHGGETEFASTRLAWERLPAALQARLERAFAWHDYAHSRDQIDPELATPAEREALPPVRWRMTWRNPVNGRTALYVASHAFAIDGMAREEAQALLARLIDEATQPGQPRHHASRSSLARRRAAPHGAHHRVGHRGARPRRAKRGRLRKVHHGGTEKKKEIPTVSRRSGR
jgi:alpha-ketoglutarate-dependent 2,4-dichlorophenoxyacetate dioxygenase